MRKYNPDTVVLDYEDGAFVVHYDNSFTGYHSESIKSFEAARELAGAYLDVAGTTVVQIGVGLANDSFTGMEMMEDGSWSLLSN